MPQRNLDKEKQAVATFQKRFGRMPDLKDPSDRTEVYSEAYPGGLPEELQNTTQESAQAAGLNTAGSRAASANIPIPQSDAVDTSGIRQVAQQMGQVRQQQQQVSNPNTFINTLQKALRRKRGVGEQSIGRSKIFQQAGVSGMGALQNSLAARKQEMEMNQTEFNNLVGTMAGQYKDRISSLNTQYSQLKDVYEAEMDRIQRLETQARSFEHEKELTKLRLQMQKELAKIRNQRSQGGTSGLNDSEQQFYNDVYDIREDLTSGEISWGPAFNYLKSKWGAPNEVIDKLLNKEKWSQAGAYEQQLRSREQAEDIGSEGGNEWDNINREIEEEGSQNNKNKGSN